MMLKGCRRVRGKGGMGDQIYVPPRISAQRDSWPWNQASVIHGNFPALLVLGAVILGGLVSVQALYGESRVAKLELRPRPIDILPPGTVIDESAPAGWSELIIKSSSSIERSQQSKVSQHEINFARMFTTVIVADVTRPVGNAQEAGPHVLSRVAAGCLTSIRNKDTIVSPSSHKKLGADLGFLGGMLLGEICKKQQEVMLVAKSESMAIIDAPVVVYYQKANRPLAFRYMLLLNPQTGELHRLVWLINPHGTKLHERVLSPVELLAANHIQEFPLQVDVNQYSLGMPTEKAFGVMDMPKGKERLHVDKPLRLLMGLPTYSAAHFAELERSIVAAMAPAPVAEDTQPAQPPPSAPASSVDSSLDSSLDARRARMKQPVLYQPQ